MVTTQLRDGQFLHGRCKVNDQHDVRKIIALFLVSRTQRTRSCNRDCSCSLVDENILRSLNSTMYTKRDITW